MEEFVVTWAVVDEVSPFLVDRKSAVEEFVVIECVLPLFRATETEAADFALIPTRPPAPPPC